MSHQVLERPTDIADVIRGNAQFGAVGKNARHRRQIAGPDEAPLGVARLRPGVRKQQKGPIDRSLGQGRQQQAGVVIEDTDVGKLQLLDPPDQRRDAIDEDLAADESNRGVSTGLLDQVLAAAEADFEP